MKNQRQATVETIISVYEEHTGKEYELNGEVIMNDVFTKEMKQEAREYLVDNFQAGNIQYRPEFQCKVDDNSEINKYVNGLINNWLRKAKELNGGEAYEPKNPGSRAGSGDPQIRELKKLLTKVKGTAHETKVQAAIESRLEEIKPKVEIDTDLIPEDLQGLL
jgi:hypothetical protein